MAGPWEEYQTPSVTVTKIGNREIAPASDTGPWTEYQTQAPTSGIPTGKTWAETGKEAILNFPASAQKYAQGFAEAISDPRKTLEQLGEVLTGTYARFIPQEWMARPDKAQEFIEKANAAGGMLRDRYGSIDALKNTIATDPVGFAADVSTLAGVGGATLPGRAGQIAAKTSRVTDPLRFTAVLPAAEKFGGMVMSGGGTALRGAKTNVLMEAAEGRAPEIINALRQQPQIVPGAMPTAGEAAAILEFPATPGGPPQQGVTRFAALQRSAEDVLPSEYRAREQAQQAARVNYLRQIGGTDAANQATLKNLKDYRSAEAKILYGQASNKPVASDSTLSGLLERPSMQKAVDRARQLAAEEGATFSVAPGLGPQQYKVGDLHYVKLALDDMIGDPAAFGIGKVEAGKITGTRNEFLKWLETKTPEYKTARETFATRSKPISQMEVGEFLEKKLMGAKGEERPGVFATAVREAPTTIKKATGQPRFEKLSDVLAPNQVKIVEDIQKDLRRQLAAQEQAAAARRAGPQATQAGTNVLIEAVGGVTAPNYLNSIMTTINAALKRLAGKIDRKVALQIATDMLTPEQAALALEQASRRSARVSAVGAPIRGAGRVISRAATPAAAVSNALAETENRNALAR
jgi:hypothetical protein